MHERTLKTGVIFIESAPLRNRVLGAITTLGEGELMAIPFPSVGEYLKQDHRGAQMFEEPGASPSTPDFVIVDLHTIDTVLAELGKTVQHILLLLLPDTTVPTTTYLRHQNVQSVTIEDPSFVQTKPLYDLQNLIEHLRRGPDDNSALLAQLRSALS